MRNIEQVKILLKWIEEVKGYTFDDLDGQDIDVENNYGLVLHIPTKEWTYLETAPTTLNNLHTFTDEVDWWGDRSDLDLLEEWRELNNE